MYSRSGAYCNSEETLKGSLAVGQVADVVVLDSVGRDCLEDIFFNATVLMTMIDGKVVWSQ
jgi:predicted amidohydrolase YtcJ